MSNRSEARLIILVAKGALQAMESSEPNPTRKTMETTRYEKARKIIGFSGYGKRAMSTQKVAY